MHAVCCPAGPSQSNWALASSPSSCCLRRDSSFVPGGGRWSTATATSCGYATKALATDSGKTARATWVESSTAFFGYPCNLVLIARWTASLAMVVPCIDRKHFRASASGSCSGSGGRGRGRRRTRPPRSQQRSGALAGVSQRGAARAASIKSNSPSASNTRQETSAQALDNWLNRWTTNHSSSAPSPVRTCPTRCGSSSKCSPRSTSSTKRSRCHK
mmetsp:Transcript_96390/g.281671  ORF Transcript_96390/g.281671 Transcript_96390/m.281671 type:complete len:216 (+) Transcript_96390:731-1378(+)